MNPIVQQIASSLELAVEGLIEQKLEGVVALAVEKLKVAIPGPWDDVLLEQIKPQITAAIKTEVLKLADKIDWMEG